MGDRIYIIKLFKGDEIFAYTIEGILYFQFVTPVNVLVYTYKEAQTIAKKLLRKGYDDYELVDLDEEF